MTLHWQHNNEWHEQDMTTMLYQDAFLALAMLAKSKLPSTVEISGGYLCSKSIFPAVKRKHKKVMTYDNLMKKYTLGQCSLMDALHLTSHFNTLTNTTTIEA